MLRDKNLIPLSHQHQRALALCVRIARSSPIAESDRNSWQEEIAQHFQQEIGTHFSAEERILFPAARHFPALNPLIDELLEEHARLRKAFEKAKAGSLASDELTALSRELSDHIRKEERQLFEQLQSLMSYEDLAHVGKQLEESLKDAEQVCMLARRPPS